MVGNGRKISWAQRVQFHLLPTIWTPGTGYTAFKGGGVTPYDGLYGEALPERGVFFRLQAYEMVGIPLAEVYERVGKSVIWVCERAQKSEQINLWLNKVEKIKEGWSFLSKFENGIKHEYNEADS